MKQTIGMRMSGVLTVLAITLSSGASAAEPAFATNWVKEHSTSVRLIGGGTAPGPARSSLLAGIDIRLDDGWKTYWRNPGSSGVPPRVDWAGSENLAEATLLFPAPRRYRDKDGDTIGYRTAVTLPVAVRPADPAKPVVLKLALEYGVCREICIPVQTTLSLTLPADSARREAGTDLAVALAKVPAPSTAKGSAGPFLKSVKVELAGPKPRITIVAGLPPGSKDADIFLEAPDGLWIPLPQPVPGGDGASRTFEVDLTDGADIGDLKGRLIRATLVSDKGQSEATFKIE